MQTRNYSPNPKPMAVGMASRLGDTNDMAQQTGRLGAAKGLFLRPQCLPVKEACVAVLGLFDQLARTRGSITAPICGLIFRILDKVIPKRNYIRVIRSLEPMGNETTADLLSSLELFAHTCSRATYGASVVVAQPRSKWVQQNL